MSTIRAWTLIDRDGEYVDVELAGKKDMHDNESIFVFEAAPTLDLLERAYYRIKGNKSRGLIDDQLLEEFEAVLRAHGRLGGET